jgi:hypothetical protein
MIDFPKILYDNRLKDAAPAASTTAAGYDVLNLRDWRAYTWWRPTALPATITVDCGVAKAANYALLYGHNLGSLGLTVEVRASTDNFAASDVLVDTVTPANDKPLLRTFASVSYRYWRWRFTGASVPTIAIAPIGTALALPRRLKKGFDPIGRKLKASTNRSESGHALGRVIEYEEWSERLRFNNITWSWMRANFIPAWEAHLRSEPFAFAWDSTDHADETYLVMAKDAFTAPHQSGEYLDLGVDVVGRLP